MNNDQSTAMEPPICTYTNWDEFYPIALRYHQATHQSDLVIDRIETFRKYMSPDVIKSLGGYVRSHPRFQTTSGWDQWVADVAELISIHSVIHNEEPAYVRGFLLGLNMIAERASTAEDLVELFKKRKLSTSQLWQGLDTMASNNGMSSTEQHQLFWEALSEDEKMRLRSKYSFFDPQDEVWEKQEPDVIKVSQQTLSRIMEFSALDDHISLLRKSKKYAWLMIIVHLIVQTLFFCYVLAASRRFWPVIFFCTIFVYGIVQHVRLLVMFRKHYHLLKALEKKQRELVYENLA